MTDHLVIPPARVWDKIEEILDEQDNRRKYANLVITESFAAATKEHSLKKFYIAAAGLSLLAGIYLAAKAKLGI